MPTLLTFSAAAATAPPAATCVVPPLAAVRPRVVLSTSIPPVSLRATLRPLSFPHSTRHAHGRHGGGRPAAAAAAIGCAEPAVCHCGWQCELCVSVLAGAYPEVQSKDQWTVG